MNSESFTWEALLESTLEPDIIQRGRAVYLQGALSMMTYQRHAPLEMSLSGVCHGSRAEPYTLHLRVNRALTSPSMRGACACPVGATGACKHIAALVLAWEYSQEVFQEDVSLQISSMSAQEKAQALELILQMYPQTKQVLALAPGFDDSETPHKVIAGLLTTPSDQTASPSQRVQRLWPLWRHVSAHFKTSHSAQLMDTLNGLVEQIVQVSQTWPGVPEHATLLLEDIVSHIQSWLGSGELTRPLIRELWDVLITLSLCDEPLVHVSKSARDALISSLSESERVHAVLFVRQRLETLSLTDHALLLGLEAPAEHATYIERALGLGLLRVAALCALEHEDRASLNTILDDAGHEDDLLDIAQLCVAHERDEWALDAVERRFAQSEHAQLSHWLEAYYARHQQWVAALSAAQSRFYTRATFECVDALKTYAQELAQWPVIRTQIIHGLRQQRALDVLLHMHVSDGELDEAWHTVEYGQREGFARQPQWIQACAQLARALEAQFPQRALVLYHQVAAAMEAQGSFSQNRIIHMRAEAQKMKNTLAQPT